jgi:hypothetical protein
VIGTRRDKTRLGKVSSRLLLFGLGLEDLGTMIWSQSLETFSHVTLLLGNSYNHANEYK